MNAYENASGSDYRGHNFAMIGLSYFKPAKETNATVSFCQGRPRSTCSMRVAAKAESSRIGTRYCESAHAFRFAQPRPRRDVPTRFAVGRRSLGETNFGARGACPRKGSSPVDRVPERSPQIFFAFAGIVASESGLPHGRPNDAKAVTCHSRHSSMRPQSTAS